MGFKFDLAIIGGLGHVGLPLGIVFASKGKNVLLVDKNEGIKEKVMKGEMPFVEYGATKLLNKALKDELISVSTDKSNISKAENIIICIGTPIDEYLNPKIKCFLEVIDEYAKYINKEQLVIIRSSIYPGVCLQVHRILGDSIPLSYCPERIVQGYAISELDKLPQIISGFTEESVSKSADLFSTITEKIVYSTISQAELMKLFSNSWRYIQFAATNQFYMISEEAGENYSEIRNLMMEGYARMSGFPSSGFTAGPCLLKDTMQLANISNNAHYLSQAAMHINEGMPSFLVKQIKEKTDLIDVTVGILGMAFKANIDDTRDSLSFKLKKILSFEGAKVLCTDEHATIEGLLPLAEVIEKSSIIIIGAPHTAYRDLTISTDKMLIDIWNIVDKNE